MSKEIMNPAQGQPLIANYAQGAKQEYIAGNKYENNIHYDMEIHRPMLPMGFSADYSFYSVLVCDFDDDNLFVLRKNQERNFDPKSSPEFCRETETREKAENLAILKTYPAIVVKPKSSVAYYGFITSIDDKGDIYEIRFFLITAFPSSIILELSKETGIENRSFHNGLEEQRWVVRKGDIKSLLSGKGIELPRL